MAQKQAWDYLTKTERYQGAALQATFPLDLIRVRGLPATVEEPTTVEEPMTVEEMPVEEMMGHRLPTLADLQAMGVHNPDRLPRMAVWGMEDRVPQQTIWPEATKKRVLWFWI